MDYLDRIDKDDEEYKREWSQKTIDRIAAWLDNDSQGADIEEWLQKDRSKNTWERYLETHEQLWCGCNNELDDDDEVCRDCR